jgi:putative transposase
LNVIDESNREGLAIEVDTSLPAARVIRVMEQLADLRGLPRAVRLDNGPELRLQAFTEWCAAHHVELRFIQRASPAQNAFVERFNRTYRHEILDAYVFDNLEQVRLISEGWLQLYNEERPHRALGRLPPRRFAERQLNWKIPAIRRLLDGEHYPITHQAQRSRPRGRTGVVVLRLSK